MSSPNIKTHRLIAHRPTQNDLAFFRTIHTDIGTMATLSVDGSIVDEETSQKILAQHITHWDDHSFGVWLFEQSSDQQAIGYCGLRNCGSLDPPEIELFFGVRSQFFNNGFGTEMVRAVVSTGIKDLNFKRIAVFTWTGLPSCYQR